MAAGFLRVTPEKLISTASAFESQGSTVKTLTNQMVEIVTGLTGQVWSGEAATAYVNKFNGLQDDIARIIAMINEHVTDLNQMAQEYQTAESTNEQMASSLSSDVIV